MPSSSPTDQNQLGTEHSSGAWEEAMPRFRERWQQRFGAHGARWESYEPRYRYGWELATQEENRGKSWFDVQANARRGWEAAHEDVLWAQAADPVRDAYEHAADRAG